MKKNMGNLDRIIRAIVTVVIGILYFSGVVSGTLGIVLLVIAGILLATSVVAFCPLYFPFKFSTRK